GLPADDPQRKGVHQARVPVIQLRERVVIAAGQPGDGVLIQSRRRPAKLHDYAKEPHEIYAVARAADVLVSKRRLKPPRKRPAGGSGDSSLLGTDPRGHIFARAVV